MTKAQDVVEPVIGRAFARPVGSSGLRAHVRFTAKATELLRRREMTRCAKPEVASSCCQQFGLAE